VHTAAAALAKPEASRVSGTQKLTSYGVLFHKSFGHLRLELGLQLRLENTTIILVVCGHPDGDTKLKIDQTCL
jgi:hypothetical protein